MRYIIATLGCKVNQYESEAMEKLLAGDGHRPVRAGETAQVVIVNSCAVTAEGARKARQTLRRLGKEHPGAVLAVAGCWSQLQPEEAARLGAQVVFGTGDRRGFVRAVERAVEEGVTARCTDNPFRRQAFEELPAGAYAGHARAYLKIQDGCDNFCTYCVIPYTRGRVLSLPPDRCAAQAAALAAEGYREIVVTGIEIAAWGRDRRTGENLADALEAIANAAAGVRLRLGSLEPTVVTEELVRRLEPLPVCPHFHLSLQSGCDATLARMGRKYDTARYSQSVELLRRAFPGCAVTTDLIVGFPGETPEEFEATLAFIRRTGFSAMHVFPYSLRPGTRAAAMPDQVDKAEKLRRAARAKKAAEAMGRQYRAACLGRTIPVLFEREAEGVCTGHGDNYVEVSAPGEGLRGLVKNVKITGMEGKMLVGVIV